MIYPLLLKPGMMSSLNLTLDDIMGLSYPRALWLANKLDARWKKESEKK